MIVFYILLALLCLWGIRFRKAEETDYLSKEQGNAVKGIFILLVYLAHASVDLLDSGHVFSAPGDSIYFWIQGQIGQLCVVMFLFFSGYGVMSSIISKGKDYVNTIPKHRALGTLVNFDIAVVIFAVAGLIAGRTYPFSRYLLALTGWESIGNSNWYIFAIILCYLSTWASAKIVMAKGRDLKLVIPINLAFTLIMFVVFFFTRERHWYQTLFAYPLGLCFPFLKQKLDSIRTWRWLLLLMLALAVLAATYHKHQDPYYIVYTIRVLSFAIVWVLVLRRVKIGNPVLTWLGKNLFPLYIYQRLPMMFVPKDNPYVFMVACLAITCLIVPLYRKIPVRL